MEPIPVILIVAGYTIAACLMTVLWSYIPPRYAFYDISLGLMWPMVLALMILAAFINSAIRAVDDQDGRFAGLVKEGDWRKRYLSKEDAP